MSLRVETGFEHLREALAEVIAREVEFPPGMMITLLGTKVTANTSHAKIILSVFPTEAAKEAIALLKAADREIKDGLAERLRLRRIPRLHYTVDATEAEAEKIEQTLHQLKQTGEFEG